MPASSDDGVYRHEYPHFVVKSLSADSESNAANRGSFGSNRLSSWHLSLLTVALWSPQSAQRVSGEKLARRLAKFQRGISSSIFMRGPIHGVTSFHRADNPNLVKDECFTSRKFRSERRIFAPHSIAI